MTQARARGTPSTGKRNWRRLMEDLKYFYSCPSRLSPESEVRVANGGKKRYENLLDPKDTKTFNLLDPKDTKT